MSPPSTSWGGGAKEGTHNHSMPPAPGCHTALSTLMYLIRVTKGPFQHTERRAGKHPEDPNINSGSEATDLLLSEPLTRPEGKESARSFQKDPQPPPAPASISCHPLLFPHPELHLPCRKPKLVPMGSTKVFSCIFYNDKEKRFYTRGKSTAENQQNVLHPYNGMSLGHEE